ncbi:glycosyltransferase [Paenibacillus sp. FJAT-27812]|uniref:glycosyltransferase n=1 Tax=Paenibacillus sp. FJAT-27812 TaxID=1684143 RepID=UPI000AFEC3B2|nr:glycosyltransferase family 2 protein [Paenibacillus sp. FJAT-27812]
MKRILIGSPIRQKPSVLRYFLASLERLAKSSFAVDYYFIDDNDDELSSQLLNEFITKQQESAGSQTIIERSDSITPYARDEFTHYWSNDLIDKIAGWKDHIIATAREKRYDGLFLIDSDVILQRGTLESLISSEKEIICAIFWTQWQPGTMELPQVWLKDTYWPFQSDGTMNAGDGAEAAVHFVMKLRIPGVYEVGGLGACTYIDQKTIDQPISFRMIPNLSLWGEDRHFCVRAAALGIGLHVDTRHPAFHIYRESDLVRAKLFMESTDERANVATNEAAQVKDVASPAAGPMIIVPEAGPKLTLSMIVKNEGDRFLKEVLAHHREYIDHAVIIDDGSTDHTGDIVHEYLAGIPLTYIKNESSQFHNEVKLRTQQWEETIRLRPQWILNMDADEYFEDKFKLALPILLNEPNTYAYMFRLYDFWSEDHYREDNFWNAHAVYRPFLLKYVEGYPYEWKQTPQHCGRFPQNIYSLEHKTSDLRVKHLGWAREQDRLHKYERYKQLDPNAIYGWREQYESILDESPNLVKWIE